MDYEKLGCLHDMFVRQAKATPDNVAVVSVDGRQMTFRELDDITDVLATNLRIKGVLPDSVVGIYMPKVLEYPISYIAILKAGGAYMPLDVSYPQTLLDSILSDSEPAAILTVPDLESRLPGAKNVITFDETWVQRLKEENSKHGDLTQSTVVHLDNLAYVVYSSGTTGKPKGIMCPHRGAVFSYNWRHENYPFKPDDRVACNVFFVWEMFRPQLKGIPMYIIPDDVIYDPPLLVEFLQKHGITRILFTPSLLEAVLDADNTDVTGSLKKLRLIVLCGEVVTTSLMDRITKALPWVEVMNLYSISESHDVATSDLKQEMENIKRSGKTRKFCPVGKLLPGVQIVIMDADYNVQPVGSPGEIYVGGPTLARGYLNRPEMNAKRFIQRPSSVPESVGDRLYRTGDWGYVLSDGNLEICGRCDTMVKIRGYSIEVQAVEAALLELPMVNSCTVLAKGEEGDDKYLIAYVVPEGKTSKKEVRAALKTRLPSYMIPSYFIFLTSIPILPASGKLDKKSLPDFDPKSQEDVNIEGVPSTDTERALASIWTDLLQISTVDVQESFFDLGGHSLLAARLLNKVKEKFQVDIAVQELFTYPTIRELGRLIGSKTNKTSQPVPIAPLTLDLVEEVKRHDQGVVNIDMQLRAFWRSIQYGNRWYSGRVLLTGATGFLGAFILRDLLLNTKNHIYCLVREVPGMSCKERLLSKLKDYGIMSSVADGQVNADGDNSNAILKKFERRVTPIKGDVSLLNLGMSNEDYTYLSFEIDSVIHSAAYVNLLYPYEALRGTNVHGTQNVVHFACTNKIKPLHHISTNSVFPHGQHDYKEDDDMTKYASELTDGYSQTKWVAEMLVQKARSRGLPVVIYRLGNLSGDSKSAFWNPTDTNLLTFQACMRVMAAPNIKWKIEMTPVDFVSKIIVMVAQNPILAVGKVFHLVHPHPLDCRQLFKWIGGMGYSMKQLPYEEWCDRLKALHSSPDQEDVALGHKMDSVVQNTAFFFEDTTYNNSNTQAILSALEMTYPPLNYGLAMLYVSKLLARKVLLPKRQSMNIAQQPLQGQVAIVTGASSGIGAAIAEHLARGGASVALAARRQDRLDERKKKIEEEGGRAISVSTNVCNRQQMKDLVKQTESQLGPVDILVNAAGVMTYTLMKNVHEDDWEKQVDVNCKGVLNGIGAVVTGMVARGKGHIVNLSSDAGRVGFPGLAVYSGTKFFVEGVSSAMRKELADSGVRITCIQPGDVTTEISNYDTDKEAVAAYKTTDPAKFLSPDDIGRAAVFAVTQPDGMAVNEILVEPRAYPAV